MYRQYFKIEGFGVFYVELRGRMHIAKGVKTHRTKKLNENYFCLKFATVEVQWTGA